MATIAAPTPLVMKDVILGLGADSYEKHVSAVTFTPSASTVTWQGLSPDASFTDVTNATWTVAIEVVQDWEQVDSLCRYLFENEGEHVEATFKPRSGSGPSFTGTVIITPGAIGGAVNAVATQSVTLGLEGRPVLVPAVVTP